MENIYKERSLELFKKYSNLYQFEEGSPEYLVDEEDFVEALRELAEEIEKCLLTMETKLLQAKYPNRYFTKDQIEETIKICTDKDYEAWILTETFREVLYKGIVKKEILTGKGE